MMQKGAEEPLANGHVGVKDRPACSIAKLAALGSEKEAGGERTASALAKVLSFLRRNSLVIFTVFGVLLGLAVGLGVRRLHISRTHLLYFAFPGELLLRLLKMVILPVVFCSLVSGAASLDIRALGKLGGRAILYFALTTLIGSALGVTLGLIIKPGGHSQAGHSKTPAVSATLPSKEATDSFLDLFR
ncbi:hypothetical protein scyTo_0022271 [Scyliorhinus torazame]|uniref:Amino acid transporter n=1 Tax=Scyliorhinus torazame TaxID=75743 RepID=A0A401Q9K6_SCYTO|nr:hypothetical protein [Scyliorhinus torazame]